MSRAVVAIFALMVLALVGTYAVDASLENAGENVTNQGESFTPDAGNVTNLTDSHIDGAYYDHEVTVTDENGNPSQNGTDYIWFVRNGTIKTITGGNLDGDTTATIDYGYRLPTDQQRQFATLLALLPQVIAVIIPVFVFVLALVFLT